MNGNRESLKFFKKIVKKMILLKNGVFRGYLNKKAYLVLIARLQRQTKNIKHLLHFLSK